MTVVVTGASSGIGAATALRLAQAGHRVIAASRSGKLPEPHPNLTSQILDIRDPAAIEAFFRALPHLDALVNSAGVAVAGSLEDTPLPLLQAQLQTNFLGAATLLRAALPHLRASKGRLIHISSLAVAVPLPYQALYCAAHAGMNSLCEALRYELEPAGIRLTVIHPGSIKTGLTANRQTAPFTEAYPHATKALAANDHDEEAGLHPNRIAAAVEKALTSPNPPERLAIAHWHEKLSAPLRSLLPEKLFRRIIAAHYNL